MVAIGISPMLRNEKGSMLVEFGLLFIPLVIVIVGMIEVAMVLLTQQVLQTKTSNAARIIETGQGLGMSASAVESLLRSSICSGTLVLVGTAACQAALKVDVRVMDGSAIPSIFDGDGGIDDDAFGVVNGGAGNSMLVRTVLELPSLTGMLPDLITFNGGQRVVTSDAVFRIDPFADYNQTGGTPPAL